MLGNLGDMYGGFSGGDEEGEDKGGGEFGRGDGRVAMVEAVEKVASRNLEDKAVDNRNHKVVVVNKVVLNRVEEVL